MKMTMQRTGLNTVPRGRGSEAGFAVPTVLMAMVATLALGAAAVTASITSQRGTVRDQNSKQALAVAEAGVANALLRFNRVRNTDATNRCAPIGGTAPGAGGWCPQTVGPVSYDRGTYSYRVRATEASGTDPAQVLVVSTGTVDGVSRRVSIKADTASGDFRPFSGLASVIGLDGILLNAYSNITAGVASNGDIGMHTGSVIDCDYLGVGIGHGLNPNNGTATCPVTEDTVSLPPVNPGTVATDNNNDRICAVGGDPCNKASWNATTKRLTLNGGGGSITLGAPGGQFNYAFCKLTLNANSYVNVAVGAVVRIYFLAPEQCSGETQPLVLSSGSKIQPTGAGLGNLALLVVGSDSIATSVILNADSILFDCEQAFVLYAPRTLLTLNANTEICGGVAMKRITLNEGVDIQASQAADDFELPGEVVVAHYGRPHDFVECTPAATSSDPASGC